VNRVAELRARRDALLERSATLRQQLVADGNELEGALSQVDRGISLVRNLHLRPIALAAGAGLLFALGPGRVLRWVTRGLMFTSVARRAFGLLAEARRARRASPELSHDTDLFV
jgi:hypothetical protein